MDFEVNKICSECEYECKIPYFAVIERCRATKEDKAVEKKVKELKKYMTRIGIEYDNNLLSN